MDTKQFDEFVAANYNAEADHPWMEYPNYTVYRHPNNRKWFALVMYVPRSKLGLGGEGTLCVVNLKCDPITLGSLRAEAGFYPAYHMSKEHWITAALDGTADDEKLKLALDISYSLTAAKPPKRKRRAQVP